MLFVSPLGNGPLRTTLLEASYWGNDPSRQKLLDTAYRHFRAYIKANKIPCSQSPFTEKMVSCLHWSKICSWLLYTFFWCRPVSVPIQPTSCRAEVVKKLDEIQFTLKGYNGRVVMQWLTHCLGDAVTSPHLFPDPRMNITYAAMTLGVWFCSACRSQCWYVTLLHAYVPQSHHLNLRIQIHSEWYVFGPTPMVRNNLATFFGLMERNPRFLLLD